MFRKNCISHSQILISVGVCVCAFVLKFSLAKHTCVHREVFGSNIELY